MIECILDTNILIRYLIRDDTLLLEKAKEIFKEIEEGKKRGFISILVIDEAVWVLENYYKLPRRTYLPKILELFALKEIKIMELQKEILFLILKKMQNTNIDFTDLYLFYTAGKKTILTFDQKLKKL